MQYNQPYGVSDPNAPYINGNPATGTAGSIPPAASIEFPQREIVNFIGDTGLTPSNSDLSQLAKAVQTSQVIVGIDTGATNIIAISPTPAVTALQAGMHFYVKIKNTISGACVLQVNALGGIQIVRPDGSQLAQGELIANQMALFAYDGARFQYVSAARVAGAPIYLLTTLTFYLNPATGSDTLYDGSSPTISGSHGPWKTLAKIASQIALYNLNGQAILVYLADGTYDLGGTPVGFPAQNGSGSVQFIGNHANPSAVLITNNAGSCLNFGNFGTWELDGVTITAAECDRY
jgi:hypothetical protein